ncbi:MAG: hypothetical protein Kow00127_12670 [Bacteroidales bacterium]
MKIFNKILIANRGEIAVRIIRSARELGIETAVIYAGPDEESLAVEMADEAWSLGDSAELSETYLNIGKIIEIARKCKAEAIHPGYGFLAENPAFVEACEKNGIVFIGPDTRAIKLMGNKVESREFVARLEIPMTRGLTGDVETLLKEAGSLPLPLLVKAAAGGGGKGMRIVRDLKELPQILESTSREAASYFGDPTVFIEQYIEEPRHIEIQVLADHYGNVVHLYERECSIQRRYQKIIEESPSPTLTPEVREQMGAAAVRIAREIGYRNAGTVEFLVDSSLRFYFLEMNTRVQVEHPVTEMVTGVDIVQEQILIAAGNPLSITQEELSQEGHAIECRIYAENPAKDFMPAPGTMTGYSEPYGPGIRVDAGIDHPVEIHSFYDPMISKLIVWDEDREHAREKMIDALQNYSVQGISTNIPFLIQVLRHEDYILNRINTRYCDLHATTLNKLAEEERETKSRDRIALAYLMYDLYSHLLDEEKEYDVWHEIGYWRELVVQEIMVDGEAVLFYLSETAGGAVSIQSGDTIMEARLIEMEPGVIRLEVNGEPITVYISEEPSGKAFAGIDGHVFSVYRSDRLLHEDRFGASEPGGSGDGSIVSPMPGKVIKIAVNEGQTVTKGDLLLIVEAMKMENSILATRDGVVKKVNVSAGEMVDSSKELVLIEASEQEK